MKVVWTEPARADLVFLLDHIAADNPQAARRIRKRIVAAARSLHEFPMRGRPGRIEQTRELVLPGLPWLLVYRLTRGAVEILTVIHGARDWPLK